MTRRKISSLVREEARINYKQQIESVNTTITELQSVNTAITELQSVNTAITELQSVNTAITELQSVNTAITELQSVNTAITELQSVNTAITELQSVNTAMTRRKISSLVKVETGLNYKQQKVNKVSTNKSGDFLHNREMQIKKEYYVS